MIAFLSVSLSNLSFHRGESSTSSSKSSVLFAILLAADIISSLVYLTSSFNREASLSLTPLISAGDRWESALSSSKDSNGCLSKSLLAAANIESLVHLASVIGCFPAASSSGGSSDISASHSPKSSHALNMPTFLKPPT